MRYYVTVHNTKGDLIGPVLYKKGHGYYVGTATDAPETTDAIFVGTAIDAVMKNLPFDDTVFRVTPIVS